MEVPFQCILTPSQIVKVFLFNVDWIKHFDSKIKEEKDGRIYIETYKGKLFFK